MIRLRFALALDYDVREDGCSFVFNIHAARTPHQQIVSETLSLSAGPGSTLETAAATGNRYLRLRAPAGPLQVRYDTTVDLQHHRAAPADLVEVPVHRLPLSVLGYVYPSRYCESDRLHRFAMRNFGALPPGHARVRAICDWVQQHTTFTSQSSTSETSAIGTLLSTVGVCRDFAHLMIALCRALNIPARFTTGIDYGADPALGPPDFHAYVEVYLGGRWILFDPSGTAIPMGLVRLGTGRNAADVAIATIFGDVKGDVPRIAIQAVAGDDGRIHLSEHGDEALSTDGAIDGENAPETVGG